MLITSGTDIRPDGKSFTWEFSFFHNSRQARTLLTYGPSDDAADIESASVMVVKRVSRATDNSGLALPFDFRNSPEVVEEFSRSGVDFVTGPTDMKLEAKVSAGGKPVWATFFHIYNLPNSWFVSFYPDRLADHRCAIEVHAQPCAQHGCLPASLACLRWSIFTGRLLVRAETKMWDHLSFVYQTLGRMGKH